jgi:hypothetical protein
LSVKRKCPLLGCADSWLNVGDARIADVGVVHAAELGTIRFELLNDAQQVADQRASRFSRNTIRAFSARILLKSMASTGRLPSALEASSSGLISRQPPYQAISADVRHSLATRPPTTAILQFNRMRENGRMY